MLVSLRVVDPIVSSQEPLLRVFPSFEVFFLFALLSATTQAPLTTIGKLLTWLTVYRVEVFRFKECFNPLPSKQSFIDRRRTKTSTLGNSAMTRVSVVFLLPKERSG